MLGVPIVGIVVRYIILLLLLFFIPLPLCGGPAAGGDPSYVAIVENAYRVFIIIFYEAYAA